MQDHESAERKVKASERHASPCLSARSLRHSRTVYKQDYIWGCHIQCRHGDWHSTLPAIGTMHLTSTLPSQRVEQFNFQQHT